MNNSIERRGFLKMVGVVGCACALPSWSRAGEVRSKRPNVIVLISDDHSADCLGALGHPQVKTPILDELARLRHAPP